MITWHIAGLVHSAKEFKEKVMTKLYMSPAAFTSYGKKGKQMEQEHLGRLGQTDREEILSEVWGAKKKLIDGKWYVELSQVAEIIGS
tara:strand:- start:315 stop:575 length:261 start_codon:yes stop_codon:yes gene_type:complete